MNKPIYLDNAATTQISEKALNTFSLFSREMFYNPSSSSSQSILIKNKMEEARECVAKAIGASNKKQIIFTSGATESNNIAIASGTKRKGEYVFSSGEHPSVFQVAKQLQQNGNVVHFCPLDAHGCIDLDALKVLLNENTMFLSTIFVNNETGAINPLKEIFELKKTLAPKALWHIDGVQALNKILFSVSEIGCDFMTFSAHKIHGPKGVGILYAKQVEKLSKLFLGGEQENNLRAGTENVPGILTLPDILLNSAEILKHQNHVAALKQEFERIVYEHLEVSSNANNASPYILSLSVGAPIQGETLQRLLDSQGIIIGTGSACSSKKSGNRVLEAMGINKQTMLSSVRISFSYFNTLEEIAFAANALVQACKQLKVFGEKS